MKTNPSLILEIVWILLGIVCILAAIRSVTGNGGGNISLFILMAVICFVFAWVRDRQRKKS